MRHKGSGMLLDWSTLKAVFSSVLHCSNKYTEDDHKAQNLIALRNRSLEPQTLGGPPPVIVDMRDSGDYIRVLLYSHYTTITGLRLCSSNFRPLRKIGFC